MTVPTEACTSEHAWTGAETSFALGYRALDKSFIGVISHDDVLDTDTPLTLGVHYNITLDVDNVATLIPIALPAAPKTIKTARDTPATQPVNFIDLEEFPADTHERLHDMAAMRDAEILAKVGQVNIEDAVEDAEAAADAAAASAAAAQTAETNAETAQAAAAASAAQAANAAAGWQGTSTTPNTIGLGIKSFTTQPNKNFQPGTDLKISSNADAANFMAGVVTAYNSSTGALSLDVQAIGGAGTLADWNLRLSGVQGAVGQDAGIKYIFNTAVAGDPGSGKYLFNNATFGSATAWHISKTDADGNALAALFPLIDDSTSARKALVLIKEQAQTGYHLFFITGALTDQSTYVTYPIQPVSALGSILNTDICHLVPIQVGDKGDTGAAGAGSGDMIAANNLTDLASRKAGYDNISLHGADVASAGTLNLEAATGVLVDVTGTTAITAITLADGHERWVRFTGALTLTNGASLVLPGAQDIVTAAGDFACFRGYASGVVRLATYMRGNSLPLVAGEASIAAAATVDLGAKREQNMLISGGAGPISSFGSTATLGIIKFVRVALSVTLTNSVNLVLPGAADIALVAGDSFLARCEGTGTWRVVSFTRAAGRPLFHAVTDNLAAGFTATSVAAGTKSTGTFTPDPTLGNMQHATNGGAHTLAPPSGVCTMIIEYTNSASAGAISTGGFTKVTGDAFSTVSGAKFMCYLTKAQTYSQLHVTALQ